MAIIYWAHLPEHTDISTEGYVGVSINSLKQRKSEHIRDSKKGSTYIFHKAIRKY